MTEKKLWIFNIAKKDFLKGGNSRKNSGKFQNTEEKIYSMSKMWEKIPVSMRTAGKK